MELELAAAVTAAAGAGRFDLFGISFGASVAAEWAAAHPAAVAHLILYGGWVRGADVASPAIQNHVLALVKRDLHRQLGNAYREYAERVPALLPSPEILDTSGRAASSSAGL